ncbi:MAG: PD-(D/E)XK nuclease family protein [Aliarcobacter sp.]|nr:PD-(D/E)XK nuclease family protein [Aliarcobacter sp.]
MEEFKKEVLDDFKNRLLKLNEEIIKVEEKSRKKGDKFNIFSILGIQRKEVETHSFLLYDLINPNGSHYQGDLYLRIFLKEILKEKDDFKIYNLLDNAKNIKVDRETFISGKGIKNGFIDFTIEIDKYYIAIEMKIDSKENGNQLDNYKTFLESIPNKEKRLYYLTLFGDEADKSKIEEDEKNGYIRISFLQDISNFIEKSIEESKNLPIIRESLIQYQATIKNITNQTTKDIQVKAVQIIDSPETARAAIELSKSLAYAWAKREVVFWKKLYTKLDNYLKDKKGWDISYYNGFDNELSEDWIVEKLNKYDFRGLYIEKNNCSFEIFLYNGGSKKHNSGRFEYHISNKYKKILSFTKPNAGNETYWKESKYKYNFSKDTENPIYDIFDNKELNNIVKKIFEESVGYIDTIIKSELV